MRLHRFYIPIELENGLIYSHKATEGDFEKNLINQLFNVFRYTKDNEILLFTNQKKEFKAKIREIGSKILSYEITDVKEPIKDNLKDIAIYVCLALVKTDKFELAVQKVTELGAYTIIPIKADRSIKRNIDIRRLERIIVEAAEQSGRVTIPNLVDTLSLKDALVKMRQSREDYLEERETIALFLEPNTTPMQKVITPVLEKYKRDQKKGVDIWLFVGPEGGWSDTELSLCLEEKINAVSFNSNVLRTETAAIAAVSILTYIVEN